MNLTLYFRLIISTTFQPLTKLDYNYNPFFCPSVHAKDGFHVSLQIGNGNYCTSENGYRKFGFTWQDVEFGFTSIHEPMLEEYSEEKGDTTNTVGCVPMSVMESVFESHGGIDWDKTISVDNINRIYFR